MDTLKTAIANQARAAGFDVVGFTAPDGAPQAGTRLDAFLKAGWQGDMAWMATTRERRRAPRALWPAVNGIIMLGANYGPAQDSLAMLTRRGRGTIAAYARGADYHDVLKKRLKAMARWLVAEHGGEVKVFVDTAPVMEKPLAEAAGIGWQGKHTNLVSRQHGSWLFLGAIFTTLTIEPDAREADHCGSCRACLDICPTDAFPASYQLDARRCISYLTIEHKGHIAREFRAAMGNRIYGCDDCLAVCPWNKFAAVSREAKFHARAELAAPRLGDLLTLDDKAFRQVFSGSPIKRTGRNRFIRNVLIAVGNSDDASLAPKAQALLTDDSALVRAMAVWALARLLPEEDFRMLRDAHLTRESDADVRAEWQAG
jgi:epoxyqueuosine reductase